MADADAPAAEADAQRVGAHAPATGGAQPQGTGGAESRRRRPRRADAAATHPTAADGPEPRPALTLPTQGPGRERTGLVEDETARWLRAQRPPHWG